MNSVYPDISRGDVFEKFLVMHRQIQIGIVPYDFNTLFGKKQLVKALKAMNPDDSRTSKRKFRKQWKRAMNLIRTDKRFKALRHDQNYRSLMNFVNSARRAEQYGYSHLVDGKHGDPTRDLAKRILVYLVLKIEYIDPVRQTANKGMTDMFT